MIKLPGTKWIQNNLDRTLSNILGSFGLDLSSKQGILKITPRLMTNTAVSGLPFAFAYNDANSKWVAGIQGIGPYIGGANPGAAFSADAATSAPIFSNDRPDLNTFAVSNINYIWGMTAELAYRAADGSAWTTVTGLSAGSTSGAPLLNFKTRLYFCVAGNKMGSINASLSPSVVSNGTDQYSISFAGYNRQFINCGVAGEKYIYIGTYTTAYPNKSFVFKWDGSSTTPTDVFEVDAQAVLAVVEKDGVPWILNSNGELQALNGATFKTVERLPFNKNKMLPICNGLGEQQICHYNGMVVDGGEILIMVNGKYADGTTDPLVPSGLWKYNETNGLFHYAPVSAWVYGTTTTANDYGHHRISKAGAIRKAKHATTASNGNLLAGVEYYTNASSVARAILINDLNDVVPKVGRLITQSLKSSQITDTWNWLYGILAKKLRDSSDLILVFARNEEDEATEATITYGSTTSFVSSVTGYAEGDFVEILQGIGAGQVAKITNITGTTFTIDQTITGATNQTNKARFMKFKYLGSFNSQTDFAFKLPFPNETIGACPSIQLLVWVKSTGANEILNFIVSSKPNQLIE